MTNEKILVKPNNSNIKVLINRCPKQVQVDWEELDPKSFSYINNKPRILTNEEIEVILNSFPNGLISPGFVTWSGSGFTYNISEAYIKLNGVVLPAIPFGQVTLEDSDETHPRIDVIYASEEGFGFLTGIPSSDPVMPQVEPATQVFLTSILVAPNTTEPDPGDIDTEDIYQENEEWIGTSVGTGTVNFESTTPKEGSFAIETTNIQNGFLVVMDKEEDFDITNYSTVGFWIRLKATMNNNQNLYIGLMNDVDGKVSTPLLLNFNKNLINEYQFVAVPTSAFNQEAPAQKIYLEFVRTGGAPTHAGFFVDVWTLQGGITQPPTVSEHNQLPGLQGGDPENDEFYHLTAEQVEFVKPTFYKVNEFSNFNEGAYGAVEDLNDGSIYVHGNFTSYKGEPVNKLVKLNSDGTRDTSWLGNGSSNTEFFTKPVHVNSDGTIFYAAYFTTFNNQSHGRIIKLLPNGETDVSFNAGTGFNNGVTAIYVDEPNECIYCVGAFGSYNTVSRSRIAKINFDGTLDTDFNPGTTFSGGGVLPLDITEIDGSIFVSGYFTAYQGNTSQRIVRINKTTGAYEGSFTPPTFNLGNTLPLYIKNHQNKVLCYGGFTVVGGESIRRIVRLNLDGSIDNTFDVGQGIERLPTEGGTNTIFIRNIYVENDNTLYIPLQHELLWYRDTFIGGVLRLNSDGSIHTNYTSVNSPNFNIFKHSNGTFFLLGARAFDPMNYGTFSLSPIDFNTGVIYEYKGYKVLEDGKIISSSNNEDIPDSEEETNFVSKRDVKGQIKKYLNLLPSIDLEDYETNIWIDVEEEIVFTNNHPNYIAKGADEFFVAFYMNEAPSINNKIKILGVSNFTINIAIPYKIIFNDVEVTDLLRSTEKGCSIELIYIGDNTYQVLNSVGNFEYVNL